MILNYILRFIQYTIIVIKNILQSLLNYTNTNHIYVPAGSVVFIRIYKQQNTDNYDILTKDMLLFT